MLELWGAQRHEQIRLFASASSPSSDETAHNRHSSVTDTAPDGIGSRAWEEEWSAPQNGGPRDGPRDMAGRDMAR